MCIVQCLTSKFCNIFQKFPTLWEQLKGLSDHLSKEEDDILQAFNKLDSNGDGFVTKDELTLYLRNCGVLRNNNDDTYIALRDVDTGEYILNGDFVMSMFRKTIQYGGTTLEYSVSLL